MTKVHPGAEAGKSSGNAQPSRLSGTIIAAAEALIRTWRYVETGSVPPETGGYLLAVPHASLLVVAGHHRGRGMVTMASRSADGAAAAALLERLGYRVARGSSTRGGGSALLHMVRAAAADTILGLTVDGPRGPAWRVQPGIVLLAARTGLPIIPCVAGGPGITLPTWDRMRVPFPFARCTVSFGCPIHVGASVDVARVSETLELALSSLRAEVGG